MRPLQFNLPRGPLGVLVLLLAGTVGLFLMLWLITTLWVLAVGAGLVGALAYGWRRLEARFRPMRWRRLPQKSAAGMTDSSYQAPLLRQSLYRGQSWHLGLRAVQR